MAPESLMGKAIDSAPSIDVWAIGIMFYSMLFGNLPFFADDEEAFGDEELIDIKNRVNVLRDVSIDMNNMNTDD